MREAPPGVCTHDGLVEKLQSYNDSHTSGENPTPTEPDMDCDNLCSIRGGHEVRLRTIQVQGHLIPQPLNGAWYQTSEAVKILYDLKQENKRIAKRVIAEIAALSTYQGAPREQLRRETASNGGTPP